MLRSDQLIATVGPNVTTYDDPGWNPSLVNCYQVVAFNPAGASPSAQVCSGGAVQPRPSAARGGASLHPPPPPLFRRSRRPPPPPLQRVQPLPTPPLQPVQPLP